MAPPGIVPGSRVDSILCLRGNGGWGPASFVTCHSTIADHGWSPPLWSCRDQAELSPGDWGPEQLPRVGGAWRGGRPRAHGSLRHKQALGYFRIMLVSWAVFCSLSSGSAFALVGCVALGGLRFGRRMARFTEGVSQHGAWGTPLQSSPSSIVGGPSVKTNRSKMPLCWLRGRLLSCVLLWAPGAPHGPASKLSGHVV